jgi:hypothetical protein
VLALVDSIPRFHIISLAKHYASIPLSTIAQHPRVRLSLNDVGLQITNLLAEGSLPRGSQLQDHATLGPILRFAPSTAAPPPRAAAPVVADNSDDDDDDEDDPDEDADWGAGKPEAARQAREAAHAAERALLAALAQQTARAARAARWTQLAAARALVSRKFAAAARTVAHQAEQDAARDAAWGVDGARGVPGAAAAAAPAAAGMPGLMQQLDDAVMGIDGEDDEGLGEMDEEDMMDDL